MYKATARIITSLGVLEVGKLYQATPELDRLHARGYLEKPLAKKKKPTLKTKPHEDLNNDN